MEESVSIAEFRRAIDKLPSDEQNNNPKVWYSTQKEHWLGWLDHYDEAGAYGRKPRQNRDAKFVYNHVVNPEMLLWLIDAAGVKEELVDAALEAAAKGTTPMQSSGAVRKIAPWSEVYAVLWGESSEHQAPSSSRLGRFRRFDGVVQSFDSEGQSAWRIVQWIRSSTG